MTSTGAAASSPVAARKARVEELNLEIAEENVQSRLEQIRTEKLEAKREQQEAAQAEQEKLRSIDEEDRRERQQRRREQAREQAAARAWRDFQDEKLALALSVLPQGAPEELLLDMTAAIRAELPNLYQSNDHDVADRIVIALARKIARPYMRCKEAEKAANNALDELPFMARSYPGSPQTEWELRAQASAIAAIDKLHSIEPQLPEAATAREMNATAHTAGKHVAREYEHTRKLFWTIRELLPCSSSENRTAAEEAVQEAFRRLPIGASDSAFNAARNGALAPFITAEAEAKAARDAAAANARLETEADMHLYRVGPYLAELEAAANGYDFEGERYKYTERIKQEIRPTLIEDLPLDWTAARRRVEELVNKWLAHHCVET